jgi:hypothetical protein
MLDVSLYYARSGHTFGTAGCDSGVRRLCTYQRVAARLLNVPFFGFGRIMRFLRAGLVAVMVGLGGLVGASPAAADPCAFFTDNVRAYYNHCTSDGTWVEIKIDMFLGFDKYKCVGPGTTYLGPKGEVRGAWYNNRRCPVGGE